MRLPGARATRAHLHMRVETREFLGNIRALSKQNGFLSNAIWVEFNLGKKLLHALL